MKKRIFALTGILLALLLVLAGCGSRAANDSPGVAGYGSYNQKSESYKASETLFDTESPMMPSPEPEERDDDAALTTDRKLIQTAWMELESRDYAQALAALEQMVTDCGGYIESRSEQGGSLYSSRYNARYASITARIPADKLETAMGAAGELCNVVSRSTDVADVTESYADTEARLKTLRLQEERLLEILSKATELSDVLELERQLVVRLTRNPSSKENLFIEIDHTVIIILIRMEFTSNLLQFIPMTKSLIQLIRGMIGFMISMIGIIQEVIVLSSL